MSRDLPADNKKAFQQQALAARLRYMYGLVPQEKEDWTATVNEHIAFSIFNVAEKYKVQGSPDCAASNIKDWMNKKWQSVLFLGFVVNICAS